MLLFNYYVRPKGKVICFEPEPKNLRELELNRDRNDLSRVEIVEAAVGAETTEVALERGLNGRVANAGDLSVPQVTLDDRIKEPIDLIKVDVEGYEGAVLEGASDTIDTYHPDLLVEIHPWLSTGHNHSDIFSYLEDRYANVEYHEVRLPDLRSKVSYHYMGSDPTARIRDRSRLLADCMEGRRENTFWAVCQE